MAVRVLGMEWEVYEGIEIALLSYDYEQDETAG